MPYRDTQHIAYRPNNYRPGSSGWVSRSPSPNHYDHPARHSDSDYWERTPSWRGPPPLEEFVNRKSIPSSPSTSSARGRGQRDDFEHSNSWKQTQADRFSRSDRQVVSSFGYAIHCLTRNQISVLLDLIVSMTAVGEVVSNDHPTGQYGLTVLLHLCLVIAIGPLLNENHILRPDVLIMILIALITISTGVLPGANL